MQKKIIVLAIAAAMAAPALALAEANVYGQANMSWDMFKSGANGSGAGVDNTSVNQLTSNSSRLGFKGSEDLGGGMAAIWQMEGTVAMDAPEGAGTSLFNRNTYLGLKSESLGTAIVGRHDTPYNMATRRLDMFDGIVVADNRKPLGVDMMGNLGSNTPGMGLDTRVSNSLGYMSPSFSGVTVMASTVFGAENTGTATTAVAPKKGTAYSLAATYDQSGIYGTVAYQTVKFGDVGTGDLAAPSTAAACSAGTSTAPCAEDTFKAFKLGGGYSTDMFSVGLVYEQPKFDFVAQTASAAGSAKSTNMYLSGKFNISSSDAVKAAYTKRGETKFTGGSGKDGATQIAVGFDHNLSKNTTVYALYSKVTVDDPVSPTGVVTKTPDPSAISFGMKHSF